MKILWLTWKDRRHPLAGGAELVNEELAMRLARDGHEVQFIVGGFEGVAAKEHIDGYSIVRVGGNVGKSLSVYWHAYRYYKNNLVGWADIVIDEVNTIPFFAKFYVKEKNVLFVHQLCREIWFYQMIFPLSLIGYLIEPLYLWLLRDRTVIAVSESTKKELQKYGFSKDAINIIGLGIALKPLENLEGEKYSEPTMLSLGSVRPMKRTDDIIKAFEIAKKENAALKLIIAGDMSGTYGKMVATHAATSVYADSITCYGKVTADQKAELLRKSHVLAVTSVKEGWCLVVTEANSQGTPAVVYAADGLRDSVKDGETGIICEENTPQDLSKNIQLILSDSQMYEKLRKAAWEWSKDITFEKSYADFLTCLTRI